MALIDAIPHTHTFIHLTLSDDENQRRTKINLSFIFPIVLVSRNRRAEHLNFSISRLVKTPDSDDEDNNNTYEHQNHHHHHHRVHHERRNHGKLTPHSELTSSCKDSCTKSRSRSSSRSRCASRSCSASSPELEVDSPPPPPLPLRINDSPSTTTNLFQVTMPLPPFPWSNK